MLVQYRRLAYASPSPINCVNLLHPLIQTLYLSLILPRRRHLIPALEPLPLLLRVTHPHVLLVEARPLHGVMIISPHPPSSGSEYGLAYADSTDYEDEDRDNVNTKTKANPPPPLPLTTSIFRSTSQTSQQSHIRFPSASDHSRSAKQPSPAHQKSSGSVSSVIGTEAAAGTGRDRSNSSLIAQALGLSQTPPSNYGRLGGPPSRSGRSASGSSSGSRSAYSRSTSVSSGTGLEKIAQSSSGLTTGKLERAMETLLEEVALDDARSSLSKSKSTGKQTYFKKEDGSDGRTSAVPIPYRSNTMQVTSSPENKPVKLPARARTEKERSSDLERVRKGKEALRGIERPAKKVRICVRCDKKIEDGRWIQVDTGGVLCEQCWKNMYLPKVSVFLFLINEELMFIFLSVGVVINL